MPAGVTASAEIDVQQHRLQIDAVLPASIRSDRTRGARSALTQMKSNVKGALDHYLCPALHGRVIREIRRAWRAAGATPGRGGVADILSEELAIFLGLPLDLIGRAVRDLDAG